MLAALALTLGIGVAQPLPSIDPRLCSEQTRPPVQPDAMVQDCTAFLAQGDLDDRAKAEALSLRGVANLAQHNNLEGLRDLSLAAQLLPPDKKLLLRLGQAYASLFYFAKAVEMLDQASTTDPNVLGLRGVLLSRMGQYDQSIQELTLAISANPSMAVFYAARAKDFAAIGQFDSALADINRSIHLNPNQETSLLTRAEIYAMTNQNALALSDFDQYLQLQPNNVQVLHERDQTELVRSSLATPMPPAMASGLPRAVGRTHDCTIFYPELSRQLFEVGKVLVGFDVAADGSIENVLVFASSGSERLDNAAAICVRTHWRDLPATKDNAPIASAGHKALIQFQILDAQFAPEQFLRRGNTLAALGRYDEALLDFNEALAAKPDFASALANRGFVYLLQGRTALALDDFGRLKTLQPNNPSSAVVFELVQALEPNDHKTQTH